MLRDFSISALSTGLLAAFVGFSSSFAIVLAGLTAVGATDAQAASGLMFASIAMGLCSIWFAIATRTPAAVAWSTPGAAFLAASPILAGGFAEAVGALILCAAAIVLTGIVPALAKAVAAIPKPIASALLAGVIFKLCLFPALALGEIPSLVLPVLCAWGLGLMLHRLAAVPMAVAAFILVLIFAVPAPEGTGAQLAAALVPQPEFVMPVFNWGSALSVALPLYLVTMAGQNIPGFTVLELHGYAADRSRLLRRTGMASLVTAPFGAIPVNMSAITAAMMSGEDANPDQAKRYWSTIVCGTCYVLLGVLGGFVTAAVSFAPTLLVTSVAGLALFPALIASLKSAFEDKIGLEPPAATFILTASSMSLLGISSAFWGLLAGGVLWFGLRKR
ncbi:MAG: benzoate/H(+) symporter BenE family transporter [Pseudomonadota bacterium]